MQVQLTADEWERVQAGATVLVRVASPVYLGVGSLDNPFGNDGDELTLHGPDTRCGREGIDQCRLPGCEHFGKFGLGLEGDRFECAQQMRVTRRGDARLIQSGMNEEHGYLGEPGTWLWVARIERC